MAKCTERKMPLHDRCLTFETKTLGPRGRVVSVNHFDVPAESYGQGWITGMTAAAEFLQALKVDPCATVDGSCVLTVAILEAAAQAAVEGKPGSDELSRRGAGVGFLRMIEEMVRFAARHCDHQSFIRGHIQRQVEWERRQVEKEEAQRQAFGQRMRDARAAKRGVPPGARGVDPSSKQAEARG